MQIRGQQWASYALTVGVSLVPASSRALDWTFEGGPALRGGMQFHVSGSSYFDFVILASLFFARFGTSRVGLDGALAQTMAQLHLANNFRFIHIPPRQKARQ